MIEKYAEFPIGIPIPYSYPMNVNDIYEDIMERTFNVAYWIVPGHVLCTVEIYPLGKVTNIYVGNPMLPYTVGFTFMGDD